jgi:hypothetical protein
MWSTASGAKKRNMQCKNADIIPAAFGAKMYSGVCIDRTKDWLSVVFVFSFE